LAALFVIIILWMIQFRTNQHEKKSVSVRLIFEGAEHGFVYPHVAHAFVLDARKSLLLLSAQGFGLPYCCFRNHTARILSRVGLHRMVMTGEFYGKGISQKNPGRAYVFSASCVGSTTCR
jgi:hypothetical protein